MAAVWASHRKGRAIVIGGQRATGISDSSALRKMARYWSPSFTVMSLLPWYKESERFDALLMIQVLIV